MAGVGDILQPKKIPQVVTQGRRVRDKDSPYNHATKERFSEDVVENLLREIINLSGIE